MLYENLVQENGPDVLLLAQQLQLQPGLRLLVGLDVLGEALLGDRVLEQQQLEDVGNGDHSGRVVRSVLRQLTYTLYNIQDLNNPFTSRKKMFSDSRENFLILNVPALLSTKSLQLLRYLYPFIRYWKFLFFDFSKSL